MTIATTMWRSMTVCPPTATAAPPSPAPSPATAPSLSSSARTWAGPELVFWLWSAARSMSHQMSLSPQVSSALGKGES